MTQFSVFDGTLRGLNDGTVALKILRDLISPVREVNVGSRADYEKDDRQADADPFEPFFHGFASLAISRRLLDYAERARLTIPRLRSYYDKAFGADCGGL